MKILMINHFTQTPDEEGNGRFHYLARLLVDQGHIVEMLTTNYSHRKKTYRCITNEQFRKLPYKLTMLHEPKYKKNVSFKRFYSHWILSKNMKKYLQMIQNIDLIYCSVPSLDVGYIVAKYCKKNKIKLIIDIQDLWPEAFKMIFHIPIISNLIFYPMIRKANYIYKSANKIIAVSDTYRNRGLEVNRKDSEGLTVYLGTNLNWLDQELINQEITFKKNQEDIWIGYLGTLGNSYDISTCLIAISIIQRQYSNIKFVLLGDGPLQNKFETEAKQLNVNAIFLGRRPYIEAMKILSQCEIVVNPLVKGATQSIINKVGDYAALGLPVINSLQNKEYQKLVDKYNIGINIASEDVSEMANAIEDLIENKNKRKQFGINNRKLAEEKFDRKKIYMDIVECIRQQHN